MKRSRRTKVQMMAEHTDVMNDVGSAMNYITFQTVEEIKDFVNLYRRMLNQELLTISQIKKGIQLLSKEGIIRKRKDKYAYVNGK